eukprot:TRINITY_DN20814_c0_g1_i2.p1 TRINITY_DN20814_c0_g1~~TRINITY_DN20814_c0_g1_i2.p1  ORF type:complete len:1031 (+),score=148.47 TRINITY_DN20814_c0_g1_i2:140-3094(+)
MSERTLASSVSSVSLLSSSPRACDDSTASQRRRAELDDCLVLKSVADMNQGHPCGSTNSSDTQKLETTSVVPVGPTQQILESTSSVTGTQSLASLANGAVGELTVANFADASSLQNAKAEQPVCIVLPSPPRSPPLLPVFSKRASSPSSSSVSSPPSSLEGCWNGKPAHRSIGVESGDRPVRESDTDMNQGGASFSTCSSDVRKPASMLHACRTEHVLDSTSLVAESQSPVFPAGTDANVLVAPCSDTFSPWKATAGQLARIVSQSPPQSPTLPPVLEKRSSLSSQVLLSHQAMLSSECMETIAHGKIEVDSPPLAEETSVIVPGPLLLTQSKASYSELLVRPNDASEIAPANAPRRSDRDHCRPSVPQRTHEKQLGHRLTVATGQPSAARALLNECTDDHDDADHRRSAQRKLRRSLQEQRLVVEKEEAEEEASRRGGIKYTAKKDPAREEFEKLLIEKLWQIEIGQVARPDYGDKYEETPWLSKSISELDSLEIPTRSVGFPYIEALQRAELERVQNEWQRPIAVEAMPEFRCERAVLSHDVETRENDRPIHSDAEASARRELLMLRQKSLGRALHEQRRRVEVGEVSEASFPHSATSTDQKGRSSEWQNGHSNLGAQRVRRCRSDVDSAGFDGQIEFSSANGASQEEVSLSVARKPSRLDMASRSPRCMKAALRRKDEVIAARPLPGAPSTEQPARTRAESASAATIVDKPAFARSSPRVAAPITSIPHRAGLQSGSAMTLTRIFQADATRRTVVESDIAALSPLRRSPLVSGSTTIPVGDQACVRANSIGAVNVVSRTRQSVFRGCEWLAHEDRRRLQQDELRVGDLCEQRNWRCTDVERRASAEIELSKAEELSRRERRRAVFEEPAIDRHADVSAVQRTLGSRAGVPFDKATKYLHDDEQVQRHWAARDGVRSVVKIEARERIRASIQMQTQLLARPAAEQPSGEEEAEEVIGNGTAREALQRLKLAKLKRSTIGPAL